MPAPSETNPPILSSPTRVLVIDDEAELRQLLERYLRDQGFEVHSLADGSTLPALFLRQRFDILILDLMMPGEGGLALCQRLRAAGQGIPILMLTAKGDPIDRIIGLESGADDYLPKPFTPRELVARIQAQMRRRDMSVALPVAAAPIRFGGFVLDLEQRALYRDTQTIGLSSIEFVLLRALATHPNRELSRDKLLDLSKGPTSVATDRSIDVQVLRLRRLIEDDPAHPRWIRTVRGVGYVFVPDAGL